MATLVGNSKYGPGHQVILKDSDKLSSSVKSSFQSNGYQPGQSIFAIADKNVKPTIEISLDKQKDSFILLKDRRNRVLILYGSSSQINGSFNHYSQNSKSNTGDLTKLKEEISLGVFAQWIESKKIASEDEVIQLAKMLGQEKNYDSIFYESAIKQLEELKKIVKSDKSYTYERQGENKTKWLYNVARKLSSLSNDNWNPADVWIISKDIKGFETLLPKDIEKQNVGSIDQVNDLLLQLIKEDKVYPISLKQVIAKKAVSEFVTQTNASKSLNLDFTFDKVDLSESFNNFIIFTKSGFAARVGFKASATTLNVSVEGRMIGAGSQMGGVDAKAYTKYCLDNYGYVLRSSERQATSSDMEVAKKELQQIVNKYSRFSNTIKDYKDAISLFNSGSDLTKKRFSNLVSYLYSFAILPKTKAQFDEHMTFCYYSAKKVSNKSSSYFLIK